MTNGTGQFIRDYMFPKNTSNTIATISEQLDSYRQIKDKIEDLRKRIEILTDIQTSGQELVRLQSDKIRAEAMIRCIGIEDLRARIQTAEEDKKIIAEKQEQLQGKIKERSTVRGETEQELIQVSADLKSSDLGGKQQQYEELDARSQMLADNTRQWNKILLGMKNWEEDDVITDYISNPVLNLIAELGSGNVTEELCQNLHLKIESAKQNIENEVEDYSEQRREIGKELKEKKRLVDDMKHNRKPYEENLRSARTALSQQLSDRYGTTVRVQIFADLFDVQEEEWKNAIEGRMGRLKRSLITEPQYAHEAAVLFRNMKQYENVDLINSKAIADSEPDCLEGSLYDAVKTEDAYVDVCLKRYLGHIMKCRSVEELEQVRDGVTPDCYSYSNFIFRHLKKKDYTTRACIGRRVSKARLTEYENDVEDLSRQETELDHLLRRLKAAREFECLKDEPSHYVKLSKAGAELAKVNKTKKELEEVIRFLREGAYKELEEKEQALKKQVRDIQTEIDEVQTELAKLTSRYGQLSGENESRRQQLEEKLQGYIANEELEQEVWELLKKQSGQSVINRKKAEIADLADKEQEQAERLDIRLGMQGLKGREGIAEIVQHHRQNVCRWREINIFLHIRPVNSAELRNPMKHMKKCLNGTGRILSRHTKKNLKKSVHPSIRVSGRMSLQQFTEISKQPNGTHMRSTACCGKPISQTARTRLKLNRPKMKTDSSLICLWQRNSTARIWTMPELTVRSVSEKMHFIRNMSRRSNF